MSNEFLPPSPEHRVDSLVVVDGLSYATRVDGATYDAADVGGDPLRLPARAQIRETADPAAVNVNLFTADEDPRNAPDAHPMAGSDRMADVGLKPRRQTADNEHYSDWAYQRSFAKVTQAKPGTVQHGAFGFSVLENDGEGQPPTREMQVARFVTQYVMRGGREPSFETEDLVRVIKAEDRQLTTKQQKALDKFNEALSGAATSVHTVAKIRAGNGPSVMKKSDESSVPLAVQERVPILPRTSQDKAVRNKARKIEKDRMHGRAIVSQTTPNLNPSHPGLPQELGLSTASKKRKDKHHWAEHHVHAAEKKLEKLAYKRAKALGKSATKLVRVMGVNEEES